MNPVKYAITNWHFTLIVAFLLAFYGISSFLTMPRAEDPQVNFTGSAITAVLPGASPQEIEKLLVDPIEEALNELSDIKQMNSTMSENYALINIEFNVNSDPDKKYQDVTSAINNVRAKLPPDLSRLEIQKYNSSNVAILQYGLVSENLPYEVLYDDADALKKKIMRVPGVRNVEIHGYPEQQISIEISPEKLEVAGVSLQQIARLIKGANMSIPGGAIISDQRRFSVQSNSEFKTIDDIGNTIISAYGSQSIRLADIATITKVDGDTTYKTRYNGKKAIFLTVTQQENTNIFQVTKKVKNVVNSYRFSNPGIACEKIFDQSRSVDNRLNGFFANLIQGMILVGIIILFFLGFRASVIVVIVIPMSILTAIGLLDTSKFGLDQISIVGLAIALGMLVDNAIVVVELVSRRKSEGMSGIDAALSAISDTAMAIINSTLTTVLAFLPLVFLNSHVGQFIKALPLTVIYSLLASLLFALTLTPLMASKFVKHDRKNGYQYMLYSFADNTYKGILKRLLKKPWIVILAATLFFCGTICLVPYLRVSLFPNAEKPHVMIDIETQRGSSINKTDSIVKIVESIISKHQQVISYATNIGKGNPRIYYNMFSLWESPNVGQLLVNLRSGREADLSRTVSEFRQNLKYIPGAKVHVRELKQGMPINAPVAFRIIGDNLDSLQKAAVTIESVVKNVKGTVNIRNNSENKRIDLEVDIDKDKAALCGIAPAHVADAIRTTIVGTETTILRDAAGKDFPVILHTGKRTIPYMEELEQTTIPSITGEMVPLRQIASIGFSESPAEIRHYGLERVTMVLSDVSNGYNTAQVTAEIVKNLQNVKLPQGILWEISGEEESRDESFNGITKAFGIALIGIFAVLVMQFGNFKQPFIVFAAIPFAISGSILALFLTGYSFSFTAFIGLTSLMGIVVNNSIILVDYANLLHRKNGGRLVDVVVEACAQRFTPIFLTTITTLLGLFPLLLSGSTLWAPLSWVIIGGLGVSTLLTLFVVPALYLIFTADNPAVSRP